ncbi:MAG TPA: VWA domain-containing protein [Clostridia bacterium]|nr:VWA domain-containing protein [Clostridia bacterium]
MNMVEKLLHFVYSLRKAGITASLEQLITALEALTLVGVEPQTFHTVLRSIFAKSPQEMIVFEKVYALCFGPPPTQPNTRGWSGIAKEEMAMKIKAGSCDGRGLGRSGIGGSRGDFLLSLLEEQDIGGMAQRIVESIPDEEFRLHQVTVHWENIQRQLDWHMLKHDLENRLGLNEAEKHFMLERLEQLALAVEYHLYRKTAAQKGEQDIEGILQELNYRRRDFNHLNEATLDLVAQQVKKLGKKLASRKGYRLHPSQRGKIDLKRTLRLAATQGGVPMRLKRKSRKPDRPELVVLCDISNSMSRYTFFVLLLVWAFQTKHKKIRSFIFVDRIAEVTHLLQKQEALEKLRFLGIYAPCSATGFTDYGRVFSDFAAMYLPSVPAKAKLIILGDGKNNWRDPQVGALEEIASKVNGIYWLNPRPSEQWYEKDSVLALYRPYCQGIYQCSNFQELRRVTAYVF